MNNRLKEIQNRINEIETIRKPMWEEQHALEDERDRIFASLAQGVAVSLKWKLEYCRESYSKVRLICDSSREEEEANKKLWEYGGNYHCTFHLVDDKARLVMDDGELYLVFETAEDYKNYLKEWNLKVNTLEFQTKLAEFTSDLQTLEKSLTEQQKK